MPEMEEREQGMWLAAYEAASQELVNMYGIDPSMALGEAMRAKGRAVAEYARSCECLYTYVTPLGEGSGVDVDPTVREALEDELLARWTRDRTGEGPAEVADLDPDAVGRLLAGVAKIQTLADEEWADEGFHEGLNEALGDYEGWDEVRPGVRSASEVIAGAHRAATGVAAGDGAGGGRGGRGAMSL